MDFETAAAFSMTYGTSMHALKQRANLQPGETLLVLGASGGVGLAAVEIGKAMGARVIAAASSAEKLDVAKNAGADELINYSEVSLKERLKELTGGQGVDVIYDPVGGKLFEEAFRSIAWNGRMLVVGFAAGGDIPALPANLPLLKGAALIGVFWAPLRSVNRRTTPPISTSCSPGMPKASSNRWCRNALRWKRLARLSPPWGSARRSANWWCKCANAQKGMQEASGASCMIRMDQWAVLGASPAPCMRAISWA